MHSTTSICFLWQSDGGFCYNGQKKAAYLEDKELSVVNIHIATVNGMAIFVGLVDTREQWKRAKEIALKAGAKKVKNYILLLKNPDKSSAK